MIQKIIKPSWILPETQNAPVRGEGGTPDGLAFSDDIHGLSLHHGQERPVSLAVRHEKHDVARVFCGSGGLFKPIT